MNDIELARALMKTITKKTYFFVVNYQQNIGLLALMGRSYRDDYTEHEVRAFNAQRNNTRDSKTFITLSEEDGVTCPRCKKFLTYIYLARNSKCYSCSTEIEVND